MSAVDAGITYFDGLVLQTVYRDYSLNWTHAAVEQRGAADMALLAAEEFDVVVTNHLSPDTHLHLLWQAGFRGRVVYVSHACARDEPSPIQPLGACLDCAPRPPEVLQALRYGWPVIDLCRMTMPGHGYNARWAPEGKPMNANDPHLCSPGPDDQVMNLLLHVLLSMFRKPGRALGRRQRQRA